MKLAAVETPKMMPTGSSFSQEELSELSSEINDGNKLKPLAVVGFSLRFPGSDNEKEFWSLMMEKRCAMSEFPKDRMNVDAFYNPNSERLGTFNNRGGHFITGDLGAFDSSFFSNTTAEADGLDPQQRILLEVAYKALENAGIPLPDIIHSKTSVHTGCFTQDYLYVSAKDQEVASKYGAIGLAPTMLANRISWFFDLKGPSVNLDSACSSSMMALDLACQGLWNGDSNMAIVGGCNLIMCPETNNLLSNMTFLSPDSRCFSFDVRGNGYARGEGVGVLVVRPLDDAIKNNNTIRAVIRSTGSNQDGRTPGITQPSKESQAELIKETYRKAGLSMASTRLFEAHGTGTAIGDPTEAGAIGSAFQQNCSKEKPLYIGAVKANVGHLEGCSGIAGIIKTILALERGIIPPNANFETLNPRIDADFLNLKFPVEAVPWPSVGLRRASVNSFGFGGANSHVILDDAYNFLRLRNLVGNHNSVVRFSPGTTDRAGIAKEIHRVNGGPNGIVQARKIPSPKLLVWSAADEDGIQRLTQVYTQHFSTLALPEDQQDAYLDDLAYTLALRRTVLPWKAFMLCNSLPLLHEMSTSLSRPVRSIQEPGLAFVFTGQGAQWSAMGKELLVYRVFKDSFLAAEKFLHEIGCQWSLLDELNKEGFESRINHPAFSQTLCTALQVALVDLLRSFDIIPSAVVGHSSGEIAAAYCVGAISSQSAWKISYYRGQLAASLLHSNCTRGAMLSVGLSQNDVQPFLARTNKCGTVTIGCINSPKNLTLTGDEDQIDMLKNLLDKESIFAKKLRVDVAYHSPHMNALSDSYIYLLGKIERGSLASKRPIMVSSVSGQRISIDTLCDASYWVKNMVSPVKFSQALTELCSRTEKPRKKIDGSHRDFILIDYILEVGPHSALQGPIRDILKEVVAGRVIAYNSLLVRNRPAIDTALNSIGQIWSLGFPINFNVVNQNHTGTNSPRTLVGLPGYQFDHSKSFWCEGRLSKNNRFRKYAHHDLLGTTILDWNPQEAVWRNFLKVSELPWIMDHEINGSILYPAAGMIVMAIEAVRQLADYDPRIVGYKLKDAFFHTPINIPVQEGIEIHFHVRSTRDSSDKTMPWLEFRLFSYMDGAWIENCNGWVQAEYESEVNDVSGHMELDERRRYHNHVSAMYKNECVSVDSQYMYKRMAELGLNYGPAFRCLDKITCNSKGEAMAEARLFEWFPMNQAQHVVHPTTLDSILQLTMIAQSNGGTDEIPTLIPTHIHKLWLSASGLSPPPAGSLEAYVSSTFQGSRAVGCLSVLDTMGEFCIAIDELEVTVVARSGTSQSIDLLPLCFHIDWKPDLALAKSENVLRYCSSGLEFPPEPVKFYQDIALLQFWFISKAVASTSGNRNLAPHLQKYVWWMRAQVDKFNQGLLEDSTPEWQGKLSDLDYMNSLCDRIQNSGKQGKLIHIIGENLPKVLEGDVDTLALLFQEELLKDYYLDVTGSMHCIKMMLKYLDSIAHKNPGLKILEVGAGTGGMTAHVLEMLSTHEAGGRRYAQYDYTDISRSFFEQAQQTFREHSDRMNFKPLNIELDPTAQGFEAEAYDIVVAASVLHTTHNLDVTIENIRKLLKVGGKLIMLEITRPEKLRTPFTFALLPGWWLSMEDYRETSPCVTTGVWHEILTRNGFSGSELIMPDYQDSTCHEADIIVSTAIASPAFPVSISLPILEGIKIVIEESSIFQQNVANGLKRGLQTLNENYHVAIVTLKEAALAHNLSRCFCILLFETEKPLLSSLDNSVFLALQTLLSSAFGSIWVTCSGKNTKRSPEYNMIDGLARTLRTEFPRSMIIILALERAEVMNIDHILRVFRTAMYGSQDDLETEYMERRGLLCINRMVGANDVDATLLEKLELRHSKVQGFGHGPPLKLRIGTPGLLDTIGFEECTSSFRPLCSNEVEIQVKAIGINFKDCLVALGRVDQPTIGLECAGVVTRAGESSPFKPGDCVASCTLDTFKTHVQANSECVILIPDELTFANAAALPINFVTAWHALYEVARLRCGETVLIHSGAGGTGQAAIQIAKYLGAEVFTTVGSQNKKQLVMEQFGIPETHIFYSRDASFAYGIKQRTRGHGVDVILNSLSGESLIASWESIAPYGRFIEIGIKDILSHKSLPMFPFARNVTFSAVDIAAIIIERPMLIQQALRILMKLVVDKKFNPSYPLQTHTISDVEKVFRIIQSGKNTGKIVLNVERDDQVFTTLQSKPNYFFDPDGTYVIAGGLGGLGRTIARWMVTRGVRFLILLSRSGPASGAAVSLLEELKSQGVHVETPSCDIADKYLLGSVLQQCCQSMPPIKGCIQSTMAVHDATFESMTFEQWEAAIAPKVHGSWNLHNLLPTRMDFFIMLSSVTGIFGNSAQGNYGAGNTYQDALARFRVALGEKATSLDLGVMESEGYLAEQNPGLQKMMLGTGQYIAMSQEVLLGLLDYYCDPSTILGELECQVALGLEMPVKFTAKGIDMPRWMDRPLFRHLHQIEAAEGFVEASEERVNYSALFKAAETDSEAGNIIVEAFIKKLAKIMQIPEDEIDVSKPLHVYGVDSLLAVEIRNWLAKEFDADIAIFDILGSGSIAIVARVVTTKGSSR